MFKRIAMNLHINDFVEKTGICKKFVNEIISILIDQKKLRDKDYEFISRHEAALIYKEWFSHLERLRFFRYKEEVEKKYPDMKFVFFNENINIGILPMNGALAMLLNDEFRNN